MANNPFADLMTTPVENTGNPFADLHQAAQAAPPSGFMGEIGAAIKNRLGNAYQEMTTPIRRNVLMEGPEKLLRVAGEGGGLIADVGLAGLKSAYKNIVPDSMQEAISAGGKYLLNTDVGKAQMQTLGDVGKGIVNLRERYPESAKNIEAGLNIAGGLGTLQAGKALLPVAKEGAAIVGDIGRFAISKTPVQAAKAVDAVINNGISKGVRPTVVGKANAGQVAKYYNNAKTAVKTILSELPEQMPKNLDEFSTAIREAKKKIYDKYSAMSQAAGDAGVMADLAPTRQELTELALASNTPQTVKRGAARALREISAYDTQITPAQAEDLVAHINTLTKPFWNNPNPSEAHYVTMLERVARNVRKAASDAVDSLGDTKYGDLKKQYGALSSIEKDVSHRAVVDARKNAKSMFDLADVATAAEFTTGILTMNPVSIARSLSIDATKRFIKGQNNPNNVIRKMFERSNRLINMPETVPLKSKSLNAAQDMQNALNAKLSGSTLPPSIDAPLQYPPVLSTAMRMPRDVSKLNELDIMIAERTAVPKTRLPGSGTLIDIAPRPPQIRSGMATGDVIIPSLLKQYAGKLPTWIEDRLTQLRTMPEAAWTAHDRVIIKNLVDAMPGKKGPLVQGVTSYRSRRASAPVPENAPKSPAPENIPPPRGKSTIKE